LHKGPFVRHAAPLLLFTSLLRGRASPLSSDGETDPQPTDPRDQDEGKNDKSNSDFAQRKAPECPTAEEDHSNESVSSLVSGHLPILPFARMRADKYPTQRQK
jgi:hypothetical protein